MKSGRGAETVAATVALCVSDPEVPERVNVALPATAPADAVTVMLCAVPGVTDRVDGCADTPPGSPEIATVTIPAKPLAAAALTLTCWPGPPGTSVIVVGVEAREKSAAIAGVDTDAGVDFPPHDVKPTQTSKPQQATAIFGKERRIAKPPNAKQSPSHHHLMQTARSDRTYADPLCQADVIYLAKEAAHLRRS
ncbi:hypothetical protein [Tunturiibacter gelidiferens]|uniref:hypothetical protein n=1 Tax=Tunturiibacter gelidiferens TaxID=3069689 RepID=UPI003D9BBA34